MRRIPLVVGIIVAAIVIGGGIGWWVSRTSDVVDTTPQVTTTTAENTHKTEIPAAVPITTSSNASSKSKVAVSAVAADTAPAAVTPNGWQERLEEVLGGDGEPEQKADQLLKMLPNLPEEGQVEVSQHLVNLTPDEHYAGLAQMVTNASVAESVASVLMTDLLNRNDGLKLPLLLSIARNESHPKHADAENLLELYLQENHGNDWSKWEQSITNFLTQNGPNISLDTAPEPAPQGQP